MSPKRFLHALVRPDAAFEEWSPPTALAFVLVVALCALSGASVAYAGDAVTDEVSGSVTVDNPDRPPEWACDQSTMEYPGCDEPETVEKRLQPAASGAITPVTAKAAVAPFAWVTLIAGAFVAISGTAGGPDREAVGAFRDGFGVAAVAAVPGVLRYALRPVAVKRSLAGWTHPNSLEGVRSVAVEALFPDGALWAGVVAVSGLWTAAVVYGAARGRFERGRAVAVPVAGLALLTTAGSLAFSTGGWGGLPGGPGVLLAVLGGIFLLGARTSIIVSKEFELIGFSGSGKVSPRSWYVALNRLLGLGLVMLGFVLLDGPAVV